MRMKRIRSFKDTRSLVTGGSSGIGLELSKLLSSYGSSVIMIARDASKLRDASGSVPGSIAFSADVSDKTGLDEVSASIIDKGGIDLLFNCAGISHPGPLMDLDQDVIERTIGSNLLGTINSCRSFIPGMSKGGHIVNFSSMAGAVGIYGYTAYSASKFGVIGFSEALRMEMKERGIGVSVVLPPDTDTPQLHEENRLKPQRTRKIAGSITVVPPEWVAKRTLHAVMDRKFIVVLTARGRAFYRLSRWLPGLTRWYIDSL